MAYPSMRAPFPPPWPAYHGGPPRVAASEGQISGDDDFMTEPERDLRHNNTKRGRARRAPVRSATDGLRSKDLNRMEGRLRDRQGGRSRSQGPHDYNLYSDPRAAPADGYTYPRYPPGPATAPNYEAGGQGTAPYYDPYGNAFGASAPAAMHTGYPHMGGNPADPMNPFGLYGAPAEAHAEPQPSAPPRRSRARPREESDLSRLKQDINAINLGRDMHREDPYMRQHTEPEVMEAADMYRTDERRRRKKASQSQRQAEARKQQDEMAREFERQFFETYNPRPMDGSGFRGSSNYDMEAMMRALLSDPRSRDYLQGQQGYRPDEMNRLLNLLRHHDRLNDNQNPIARLLAQQNGSVDRDGILKRLDDMMYHQRRIEETVGELLYRVRDDAVTPRPASSARPRLPAIDRAPASVSSARHSLDDDIQSLRESLQRLPMGRDGQTPLPPEVEEILSKQSTEATLQALRHRSRPGSPNESEEYSAPKYREPRRKSTKNSGRLRQRMGPTDIDDTEDMGYESDEGFDMVPQQHHANGGRRRRAGQSSRRDDPGDTTAADEVDIDATRPSRSSGSRRGRGIRIRPATEAPAVPNPRMPSRSKSRPRPAIGAARRSGPLTPDYELEESDEESDEDWDEPNPFSTGPSRAPSQHRFGPSHTAQTASRRWRAGSAGIKGRPRAPSPPRVG